jgi:hypothetical protein
MLVRVGVDVERLTQAWLFITLPILAGTTIACYNTCIPFVAHHPEAECLHFPRDDF